MKSHKEDVLACIRQSLQIPKHGYFSLTNAGYRFCQIKNGKPEYTHIESHLEKCDLLHSHFMIDGFSKNRMWVVTFKPVVKNNGSFDMVQGIREVQWNEFEFNYEQCLEQFAIWEYNRVASISGLAHKAVRLFNQLTKAV